MECPHCHCPLFGQSPRDQCGLDCPFCGKPIGEMSEDVEKPGPLIGWRGLRVHREASGVVRLYSPVFPLCWEPGVDVEAVCAHAPGVHNHTMRADEINDGVGAPYPPCSCGFYAGRTRDHLVAMGYQATDPFNVQNVLVEVLQWGKVVVATNGFRAQHCRLIRVYVPDAAWKLAKEIEAEYGPHGVEVVLDDTLNLPRAIVPEWCEECGTSLERTKGKQDTRDLRCGFCGHYNHPKEV